MAYRQDGNAPRLSEGLDPHLGNSQFQWNGTGLDATLSLISFDFATGADRISSDA